MGKVSREIVGDKVDEIIEQLNKALADEWLAYTQYVFASKLVNKKIVEQELVAIATEELEHADELVGRIVKLGGTPVVDPKQFFEITNCGYEVPTENVKKAVEDAIKGEGCAIKVYKKIADMTRDADPLTYNLVLHIMEEEEDHETRFETLLETL